MKRTRLRRFAGAILALAMLCTIALPSALASQINPDELPKTAADVGKLFQSHAIVAIARVESIAPYNFYDEQGQAMSIEDSSGQYLASVKLDIETTLRTDSDEGLVSPIEMVEMCGLKQGARYIVGLAKRDATRPGSTGYEKGSYTIRCAMKVDEKGQVLDHEWTARPICTLEEAVKAIGEYRFADTPQAPKPDVPYKLEGRNIYSITVSKNAYVYASAKTSAHKKFTIGKGDALIMSGNVVVSGGKRFVRVVLDNGQYGPAYGYVLESAIAKAKDGKTVARTTLYQGKCAIGTVVSSRYVYAEASATSAKMGVLRKGSAVAIVTPMIGKWYKVNVGGKVGFVSEKYIGVLFDEEEPNP